MELVRFACPSCGAELPPTQPTAEQRCEYCGSRFAPHTAKGAKTAAGATLDQQALIEYLRRVHDELAASQASVARAEARAAEAEARAKVKPKPKPKPESKPWLARAFGVVIQLVVLGFMLIVIAGVLAAAGVFELDDIPFLGELDLAQRLDAELSSEGIDPWAGPPMLAEIAGGPAVVVRVRDHQHGRMYVDAYALPSAARRWRVGPLNRDDDELEHVRFTIAGPWVAISGAESTVYVHALDSGARIRSADVRDLVDYLCTVQGAAPGVAPEVYVRGVRRRHELLDPETGELTRQRSVPLGCEPERAAGLDPSIHPMSAVRDKLDELELIRVHAQLEAGRGLALASGEGGGLVVLGFEFEAEDADARAKRLARARELRLDVAEASWRVELGDETVAGPSTLAEGQVFVAWTDAEGATELTAIALEGGARLWSSAVEPEIGERLVSLRADADHLLVARTHVLEIRDAHTGELRGTIGETPG